jgi:hypothetical protein
MADSRSGNLRTLRIAVSCVAGIALVVRVLFPQLTIDAVSLGLIALGVLPWLAPLIKSAELPGGIKIEFQDVKEAAEKVAAGVTVSAGGALPEPAFLSVADQDPGLALAGLRIEIERRLRQLAELAGLPRSRPLTRLTLDLQQRGLLGGEEAAGLRQLISIGNQAAHGVEVSPDAAGSAVDYGPAILRVLDVKIAKITTDQ